MAYRYEDLKPKLFTEDGMRLVLTLTEKARRVLPTSGVMTAEALMKGVCGDAWTVLAGIDFLVESGRLREITLAEKPAGQHRVFAATDRLAS
jgi:hypothetical protein